MHILVAELLHGRHVSTSSRSSSGPNLRLQILHKLTHKIQVGIPVVYNVSSAFVSVTYLSTHYNGYIQSFRSVVFTHPITNPTFNL